MGITPLYLYVCLTRMLIYHVVVVGYFAVHYCLTVYSQYYMALVFFYFLGMTTEVPDPCQPTIVQSIGKYILYQPILSLSSYYFILNTDNVAYTVYDYTLMQILM
jgi:hypothetical protein